MKRTLSALAPVALMLALLPAAAFAQSVGTVVTSWTPSNIPYAPGGQNVDLGTITLTNNQGTSVQISSLPLMITGSNGGLPTQLSGCNLYNYQLSSAPLLSGSRIPGALGSGTNTLTFDQPLVLGQGTTNLTLRCNVDSSAPSTSIYTVGNMSSVTSGASNSGLGVGIQVMPNIVAGMQNTPIATIIFDPSQLGGNANLSSFPIVASYGGNLSSNMLTNCHYTNAGNTVATNNTSGTITNGSTTIGLTNPSALTAGGGLQSLVLSCDVAANAPAGGTLALTVVPGSVVATGTNGSAVQTAIGSSGVISGQATISSNASSGGTTGTTGSTGGTTGIPNTGTTGSTGSTGTGIPNTGAGANAAENAVILAAALLLVLGSGWYLQREK